MRGRKPAGIVAGTSPVTKVPPAPTWLSKDAKAEWRRVAPILVNERKVLTEADLGTLESYCIATGTVREAHRALNRDGLVVAGKRHPAFGMMNAAQTTARLCAAELGLTPVSRSRPAIREDEDDELSPLDF
ncbi:MAG: phage terminase small subunit P27 family [Mesorhizobium sp.]|uniref:phage terminase small subunit P27 family n=2 Tax=Mesorhizobium sp. TaxID=1871066 RepID=UPI000FE6B84A|nr:phage terminase small subunit P27 family [Mesorhizobium sp.]RWE55784.1 MAG: phage terminase small subunit P27 family [Mesorhizobium sp.]RWF09689.1 MAG: phage terminase small subunit P27 family [Mesorhizobium sp.]